MMNAHEVLLSIACLMIIGGAIFLQITDHNLPWWMMTFIGLGPLAAFAVRGPKP